MARPFPRTGDADRMMGMDEQEAERETRFAAIGRLSDAFATISLDELEEQVKLALEHARGREPVAEVASNDS